LRRKTEITVGKPLSRYAVRKSIEAMYSIGEFAQVEVIKSKVPDGIVLIFQLTSKIFVRRIIFSGSRLDEDRMREVIKSRPDKEYNAQVARADADSIRNLYKEHGYFQAEVLFIPPVDLPLGGKIDLLYKIVEGTPALIRAVEGFNDLSLKSKELKRKLKSRAGQPYQKQLVEEDMRHLKALYREEGYLTVQIQYVLTYHEESNEVALTFKVVEGKKVNVEFEPDDINDKELREMMNLFKRYNYSDAILELDRQHIKRFYEQKGYHKPEVTYKKKDSTREVTIQFKIELGIIPYIAEITFEGNRDKELDDKALLELMKTKPRSQWTIPGFGWLFSKGIFDRMTFLKNDLHTLELAYRKGGYPNVQIDHDEEIKDDQLHLHIKIREGKFLFGFDSAFQVNLDNNSISASLRTVFQDGGISLSQNVNASIEKAESNWLITDVDAQRTYAVWKEGNKLNVYEAEKQVIDHVSIRGNHVLKTDALWAKLDAEKGKPYSEDLADGDRLHLRLLYAQEGYIYANIDSPYNPETGMLTYQITEGEKAEFGRFYFHGNPGVKLQVLAREFKHLEGVAYQPNRLEEARRRLYTFGLFRRVDIKTPDRFERKRVVDIDVYVDVRKPRSISVSGGYSRSEGIRGTIGFTHYNLFKRNTRMGGKLRVGTRGNLYEFILIEPWLIGPTIGTLRFFEDNLEEQDDTRARGGTANLARRLGLFSNLGFQYKLQELRQKLDSSETHTTVSSLGMSFHRDNRLNFLDPRDGWLNEFAIEYAGGFLGGKTSFTKFTADNRLYRQIGGMVFAGALRLGYAQGLRSNRKRAIASFERFRAGGSTTVRGYKERSLGPVDESGNHRGDVRLILNTELRFPIYKRVGGVLFFDAGNVWNDLSGIKDASPLLHSSVGIGVRVNTPLGPARIDYGFPLVTGNSWRVYFELGHAF